MHDADDLTTMLLTRVMHSVLLLLCVNTAPASDCPTPPATPKDRRVQPDLLTLGHWNTEWLFDGVGDPSFAPWSGASDSLVSCKPPPCNAEGAAVHMSRVAEVLTRLDADIWSLAEVTTPAATAAVSSG